ncbi:DUF4136 domain-containing protein [Sphingobium sufflavum]|uniref:DUF4136 domain-containing protein n=1 Tax=Sphingobium sufflavum TaxID=1129547 RepID=UPI001F2B98C6|nr:DUF4136 domain-containing protein [Sphingobium sufflavum]MCE7795734.1 DUF4136 domain-containing protein [Sphingobium sufflavum]
MTGTRFLKMVAAPALALVALSGCATGFNANVSRFQQLPPAQGESFTVVPEDSRKAGGLEFAHYADLVAQQMGRFGYVRAADPAAAQLVVRVDYDVDQGRERVRTTGGFGADPFLYGGYAGYGYGRRWGWGGRWGYGFNDPFLFGGYPQVDSYTVYGSTLKLRIDKSSNGKALFEGTASAQSLSNKLTYVVPNLIDAMFTNFPGNSGEEVKVTVAPEPKK